MLSASTSSPVREAFMRLQRYAQDWNLPSGRAIHAKLIKGYLPLTLFLHNHLLNMYVKIGDIPSAHKLFDEMPQRNVVSWSSLMAGLVRNGSVSEALSLFSRMHREGLTKPNEFTFVSTLHACSLTEHVTPAYQVYSLILRSGLACNLFLINAFLAALVKHGKLSEALRAFETSPDKDIVSWNTMMGGYMMFSCKEIPAFWCYMSRECVKPDNFTFASVFTGLAAMSDLELGVQLHGLLLKSGYGDDICVGNSLVDMYIKCEKLVEGFRALDEMPEKDVRSWSQIAAGCLQCGEPMKVLAVVARMMQVGVMPNKFTLATALSACASLASLEGGTQIHAMRIKLESDIDVCVENALLDMYAKGGCMDSAWDVFRSMNCRSVISWTTMIMACAQNGQPREALQIFEEMREANMEPNHITFVCVLYACSQGKFVDDGWKYFSSMTKDYGIRPREDHYACMVNLLGRAGHTKEAEELILTMPFQPGALVWQTLLGACQVHGDVEIGKIAAEHAIRQDKKDPSTYLLLSNMFAELSNWDGVLNLRELMEIKGVKKVPGSSWIEIEKS